MSKGSLPRRRRIGKTVGGQRNLLTSDRFHGGYALSNDKESQPPETEPLPQAVAPDKSTGAPTGKELRNNDKPNQSHNS